MRVAYVACVVAAFFAIQIGLSITAALVVGKSTVRRALAAGLLVLELGLPFFADQPLPRGVLTYIALLSLMKTVQIATSPACQWTPRLRIWTAVMPFDVRRSRRAPPRFDLGLLTRILSFAVLTALAWSAPFHLSQLAPTAGLAARVTASVVFIYALIEVIAGTLGFLHRLAGMQIEAIQRDPAKSRTVAEFWGERWNLPVSHWLNQTFFHPLARRRHALAGMVAAFAVSAAFHGWLLFAAVDGRMGLIAASFFVLQVPAIVIERSMGVRQWPAVAAHAWTLLFLLASSPLLTLPLLRGLEMQSGK